MWGEKRRLRWQGGGPARAVPGHSWLFRGPCLSLQPLECDQGACPSSLVPVLQSTLFNALCSNSKAQAANFPFCTIEPNVGVVAVPDPRLDILVSMSKSGKAGLAWEGVQGPDRDVFIAHHFVSSP